MQGERQQTWPAQRKCIHTIHTTHHTATHNASHTTAHSDTHEHLPSLRSWGQLLPCGSLLARHSCTLARFEGLQLRYTNCYICMARPRCNIHPLRSHAIAWAWAAPLYRHPMHFPSPHPIHAMATAHGPSQPPPGGALWDPKAEVCNMCHHGAAAQRRLEAAQPHHHHRQHVEQAERASTRVPGRRGGAPPAPRGQDVTSVRRLG